MGVFGVLGWFVIVPAIARKHVEDSNLVFTAVNITDPQADNITIWVKGYMDGVPVTSTVHASNMTLSFGGKRLGYSLMPALHAVGGERTEFQLTSAVVVQDVGVFADFSGALIKERVVEWTFSGTPDVTCWVLGVGLVFPDISFTKSVEVPGCNNLPNVTLDVFSLAHSTPTEVMADMTLSVLNPSIVSVNIGVMFLDLYYEGAYVGTLLNQDNDLQRGFNTIRVSGFLKPNNMTVADDLMSAYLSGRPTTVLAHGRPCNDSVPLYRGAISQLVLAQTLKGNPNALVDGLFMETLEMKVRDESTVLVAMNATVEIQDPLGRNSPMHIDTVALNVHITGDGENVGTLHLPPTPVHQSNVTVAAPVPDEHGQVAYIRITGRNARPWSPRLQAAAAARQAAARAAGWELDADGALVNGAVGGGPVGGGTMNISMAVTNIVTIDGDGSGLVDLVGFFMNDKSVTVGMSGAANDAMIATFKSALMPGEEQVGVPITVSAQLPGMAGLKDARVLGFTIPGDCPQGIRLTATVLVHNPSPADMPLGHSLTVKIVTVDGQRIGTMTATDPVMRPGLTELQLAGVIDPAPGALAAAGEFVSAYVTGRNSTIYVRGESVDMGGGKPTPRWMTEAVQRLSLQTVFPGNASLSHLISNLSPVFMSFVFNQSDYSAPPVLSGELQADFALPFNISLDIKAADATVSMLTPDGYLIGTVQCKRAPVKYTHLGGLKGSIALTITGSLLDVTNATAFNELLYQLLMDPKATISFVGHASPYAETVVGVLPLTDLPIKGSVTVRAVDHFSNPPVALQSISVVGATPKQLTITGVLRVCNPTLVHVSLGPISLHMGYQGLVAAVASTDDFNLPHNDCTNLVVTGALLKPDPSLGPAALAKFTQLLQGYLTGANTTVSMLGYAGTTPIPLIRPALSKFVGSAVLPGQTQKLVTSGLIKVGLSILGGTAPVTFTCVNPFNVDFAITKTNLTTYGCLSETSSGVCDKYGDAIGWYTPDDLTKDPLTLGPNQVKTMPPHTAKMSGDMSQAFKTFLQAIFNKHHALVRATGWMMVQVGGPTGFSLNATYEEKDVPLSLQL